MNVSICDRPINFSSSRGRVIQVNLSMADWSGHVAEDVEVTIPKSMVEKRFGFLKCCGRATNNVNNGHMFRKAPGYPINGRKFPDTCTTIRDALGGDMPKVVIIALSPLTRA